MRYKIRLSYDGKPFCGWQIQNNAETVQGSLEKALQTYLGTHIQVTGAGRTDSEVNAVNYIAHFDIEDSRPVDTAQLTYKLNAILPHGISVHEISEADANFHARFDAVSREYRYFIHFTKDPFCERYSYKMRHGLDVDKMNQAAGYLIGQHDFSCFEKTGGNNATSICTISEAFWETYRPDHCKMLGYPCGEGEYIVFTIKADRFLRNMVRAIVGSLVEVGRGKKEPEWIKTLIADGTRSDAGSSVPGHALFFCGAAYK